MKPKVCLRAAIALLGPLSIFVALGITVPTGCGGGGGGSATPAPTTGALEIGFVDSPSLAFQRMLLNVVAVRLNPRGKTSISLLDPNWVTIPAPSPFGTATELQIDLQAVNDNVQLFGTRPIPVNTYRQVEIILDANQPGFVVPNCPTGTSFNDGCLSYPFQLSLLHRDIRFPLNTPIKITHTGLKALVIDLALKAITSPSAPGGSYELDFSSTIDDPPSNLLGTVIGTVSGAHAGTGVTAELSGTGIPIARASLESGGAYTLQLPAASGGAGTPYDLFVSGGGVKYEVARAIPVMRASPSVTPTPIAQDFTVVPMPTGKITGKIVDANTTVPIQGATLSLLVGSNCEITPTDCVVVAKANTDENGQYPLAGNAFSSPQFSQVPLGMYTLQVSAAGYDTIRTTAPVRSAGADAICDAPNTSRTNCSFSLDSNIITGNVLLDSPVASGSEVQVMIAAEDFGTNHLENVTVATIPESDKHAAFSINVPTMGNFDLFATAQDFFNGAPSPFPGHTIEVHSDVASGPAAMPANCDSPPADCLGPLACVGHASVGGTVTQPSDSATMMLLSKNDTRNGKPVQLMESTVSGGSDPGHFSFCAPPDTYTLTRAEVLPTNAPTPTGAAPTPTAQPTMVITLPTPTALMSPCPSICSFSSGCPGVCAHTGLGTVF